MSGDISMLCVLLATVVKCERVCTYPLLRSSKFLCWLGFQFGMPRACLRLYASLLHWLLAVYPAEGYCQEIAD